MVGLSREQYSQLIEEYTTRKSVVEKVKCETVTTIDLTEDDHPISNTTIELLKPKPVDLVKE